jgi:signal transduction histidine kinase
MSIKSLRFLPLSCLVIFSACGQPPKKHLSLSRTDSLTIASYENKSRDYLLKYPDSAVYFADRGLKLARQLHDRPAEGILLDRMAAVNAAYGNLDLAIRYQQEAQKLFGQLKDRPQLTVGLSALGILKARAGQLPEGTRLVNEALAAYQQQKNIPGLIKSYTRLGEIRELAHDLPGALTCYEKAEALHLGQPLSDDYFELINSIGKMHTKLGNHAKAAGYYERGADKSLNSAFIQAHIRLLNKAGKAYDSLGNKSKALGFHRLGLQKARLNHMPEEEARSLMGIASVIKNEHADQSIRHLKNALEIARGIGHKQLSAEIYYSLSDIYRQQSRYQEAMSTLSAHHRLLDSLLQANEGHRIAVLQGSYALAESKLHIEDLELADEKHLYQRNEGLIAAGCILLLLVTIYWNFRRTRRLNTELTASNQIKDKLFSIIGHDLRNPIGGITQLLAMMEENHYSSEEAHELIVEMRKQGNVTMEILNALLNWGEAQLKGIHVKPVEFNAGESVRKNILALQQQAADKGVTVTDQTPPELLLHGDQNHFEFLVRNLLSNAIKFSHPGGKVVITAALQPETRQAVFSVQDAGQGISPEQQARFRQSNMDIAFGTKGEKGTGIGLMLSKEFIKANQGSLWLESQLGKGSTFYFSFPAAGQA